MSESQTLSARSRAMLKQADKEAEDLRHRNVEPEHLLLAMLKTEDTIAAVALEKLGLSYEPVLEQVRKARIMPNTTGSMTQGASRRTRLVLKTAADEAKALGKEWIEPEHILLALPHEPATREGTLRALHVNQDNIREQVYIALGLPPPIVEVKPTVPPPAVAEKPVYYAEVKEERRISPVQREIREEIRQISSSADKVYRSLKPIYILLLMLLVIGVAFGFNRWIGATTFVSMGVLALVFVAWYFGKRR
ncbi:MAG: Clp protease N-terminal domain-containing protein [Anaerolineae bacterium]